MLLPSLACIVLLFGWLSADTKASNFGFTTLMVDGDAVTIFRDEFGVPHIFALTNSGLFEAYGFTVAEDRLWQLELNRRAARGRLAEILGPSFADADRVVRVTGYTDAELNAQFVRLTAEEREIFTAYRDGINRYLAEVVARDPLTKLPFEFHVLGISPEPWTVRDSVAFGAFMARQFGEIGGRELKNQALLRTLIEKHGVDDGYAIFNDVRWVNDPDAPVTVPSTGATGRRQKFRPGKAVNSAQVHRLSNRWSSDVEAEARARWESIGIPTKLGSYAWVVSAAKSAEGFALLYGGPQMGFSAPEVLHEVQLKGGHGFSAAGMAFAGLPAVLIGRNEHVAWTSTTATGGQPRSLPRTPLRRRRWPRHRARVRRRVPPIRGARRDDQRSRGCPGHLHRVAKRPRSGGGEEWWVCRQPKAGSLAPRTRDHGGVPRLQPGP